MHLNAYKSFLIRELYQSGIDDLSKIKNEVNLFVLTKQGEEGYISFQIKQLRKKITSPRSIGLLVNDYYDSNNIIQSQKE